MVSPEDVLDFWFGPLPEAGHYPEDRAPLWFRKSDETDDRIRTRFGDAVAAAHAGDLQTWAATPRGRLALIVLIDQFSRNIYRGEGRAFAADARAYRLAAEGIDAGMDRCLTLIERVFFYLPLEHAEDLEAQHRSVAHFQALKNEAVGAFAAHADSFLSYAERHREVIERFGRYPHRNAVLGRTSTPEEETWIALPGTGF